MRGYVIVPVEPTDEMIEAGKKAAGLIYDARARACWSAMLTAAPVREEGGAVDGPEDDELPGDFLARVGMDGALWADGFRKMALKLGYSDMDEGWLIGWFCNAVMAGYDHAQRRFDPALATREEAPAEAGERETLRVLLDNMVIAQSLSKELRQRATDEARSYLYALRAQPQAREEAQPVAWVDPYVLERLEENLGGRIYPRRGISGSRKPLYDKPPAPEAEKLRVAVEAFMPTNVDLENSNIRDDQILPLDVTVGELRALSKALAALQQEGRDRG